MKLQPTRGRWLLLLWFAACFVFSSLSNLALLAGLCVAMAMVFWRQALRAARRILFSAIPITLTFILASWAYARWIAHTQPPLLAYGALFLRSTLITFTTFAVLGSVDLLRALAPWPTMSRLLVITLAQIHALRLLANESLLGLRSRLLRKPGALDVLRGAGGVTGTLLTLSQRNAREITDALRARGF